MFLEKRLDFALLHIENTLTFACMHLFSLAMHRIYLRPNLQMFISYYSRWRIQWNLCIQNNYKYLDKEWQCSEHSVFKLDCYKTFAQWTIFYKFWEFIFSAINVHLCMLAHMLCLDKRRIFIFKVVMCVNTLVCTLFVFAVFWNGGFTWTNANSQARYINDRW